MKDLKVINGTDNTISVVTSLYRFLLPESVRQFSIVVKLKTKLQKLLGHDWLYSPYYYDMHVEGSAAHSAKTIAKSICNSFGVKSVIDVGCGTGALLEAFQNRGCKVLGLEYSQAALNYCRARRIDVVKFDLKKDFFTGDCTFDVAVSMEVAEHLPEVVSDRFVDLLTGLSPAIVFTAASPGQGGTDHVNEQSPLYWADKFDKRGFKYIEELSQCWSEDWKAAGDVESWYHQNLMVFQRV